MADNGLYLRAVKSFPVTRKVSSPHGLDDDASEPGFVRVAFDLTDEALVASVFLTCICVPGGKPAWSIGDDSAGGECWPG